jgi:hypothetical protein
MIRKSSLCEETNIPTEETGKAVSEEGMHVVYLARQKKTHSSSRDVREGAGCR